VEGRDLGEAASRVPAIGLGTWRTFDTDDDQGPLVDVAMSAGITLFDSSRCTAAPNRRCAERLDGRREAVKVATKVWTESPKQDGSRSNTPCASSDTSISTRCTPRQLAVCS